jgi:hypothetical protein
MSLDVTQPSGEGTLGDTLTSDASLYGSSRSSDTDTSLLAGFLERLLGGVDDETVYAIELLADADDKERRKLGTRNLAKASGLSQSAAGAITDRMLYRCSSPQQMWALFGPVEKQFETEPSDVHGLVRQRLRATHNT